MEDNKLTVDEILDRIQREAQSLVDMCKTRVDWYGLSSGRSLFYTVYKRLEKDAKELFGE